MLMLLLSTSLLCLNYNVKANEELFDIPEDLSLGASVSAFQTEGAWNLSGKGENIWDRYAHEHPEKISDGSNADIASDSYHKYKEDIQLLKELGLKHYRFSISWSRTGLPTGYSNVINQEGINYYHKVLDELEKYNITPYVSLLHFDHPQVFQYLGGWANDVVVDLFADYARVVFREFGYRIKMFGTINEPTIFCGFGYKDGIMAPGLKLAGYHGYYLCIHNILKAHARAYHIYDDEFRAKQNGQIGIVPHCSQYYANNVSDTQSAELAWQYDCGLVGHPIFSRTGDYPKEIKNRIAANSKFEGLERSRLQSLSKYWVDYIKGTSDYLGLNHYIKSTVEKAPKSNETVYANEIGVNIVDINLESPEALRDLLIKIKDEYGDVPVHILESGRDKSEINDNLKMKYIYLYLKAALTAKKEHSCNVKAFTVWSFIDTFETFRGYSAKYGLIHVDFDSFDRTRTIRKSGRWFSSVLT